MVGQRCWMSRFIDCRCAGRRGSGNLGHALIRAAMPGAAPERAPAAAAGISPVWQRGGFREAADALGRS